MNCAGLLNISVPDRAINVASMMIERSNMNRTSDLFGLLFDVIATSTKRMISMALKINCAATDPADRTRLL